MAGIGRFGSYVQHGKTYANLEAGDDVLAIGLNRAVTLIAEKKLKPGKGRRFGADPGRLLGEHPDKSGPVVVKNGRYGPYVSHDGVNATLPSDITPETVTLEQALPLLDAREARGTGNGKKVPKKPAKVAKGGATAAAPTASSLKTGAPKSSARKKPAKTKPSAAGRASKKPKGKVTGKKTAAE
jgi:DNA topoisomerase-1